MMTLKKKRLILFVTVAVLVMVLCLLGLNASEAEEGAAQQLAAQLRMPDTPTHMPPAPALPETKLTLAEGHPALMRLEADGTFRPEADMTRGELARALAALVDGEPRLGEKSWRRLVSTPTARDAAGLDALGIMQDAGFGELEPDRPVGRRELAGTLMRLAPYLDPEPGSLARELARLVVQRLILPEEGEAETEDETMDDTAADGAEQGPAVTRREAALVLELLSGRTPDSERLFLAGLLPPDMDRNDWTWPYLADAAAGQVPAREPGVYRLYGWLYAADENGALVRDQALGVWAFGPDGAYTTGDAELDGFLFQALEDSGANELEGRSALEAVYLYVKENFEYLVTPLDGNPEEVGSTGWEYVRASRFFHYGGGTCYGYAATFGLLARLLGENAQIVAAQVNEFYGDHSFVVIPEDGIDWIYDVELEDARPERHEDLALFHIENFAIYNYWYTPDW